jgi:glutamyl-Q tRNA(Asp) synthetase
VTRFAPSPTGRLHLGHAFSALFAERAARAAGGRFLLRIEDIDGTRCREDFVAGILDDLVWLGLTWTGEVRRQSLHMDEYRQALGRLAARGLVYPCFCTRREIREEIARAGAAPHPTDGADEPVYPGTCRRLDPDIRAARLAAGDPHAWRLDVARSIAAAGGGPLAWQDRAAGAVTARPERFGDVVLARKETPTSYHLAVTLDDAVQGVTLVTRGKDLFAATDIHRLLQALLDLPTPIYHHHELVTDASGRRLAKRDQAPTLLALREGGADPAEVRHRLGF